MERLLVPPSRRWPPQGVFADRLTAGVLALFTIVEVAGGGFGSRTPAIIVVGVVMAASLAWRRATPLPAFAVSMAAYLLLTAVDVATDDLNSVAGAMMIGIYSVAVWDRRRNALVGAAVAGVAACAVIIGQGSKGDDFVFAALLLGGVWTLGRAMRARLLQVAHITEETVRLQLAREYEAAAAVTEERTRIARELHDIVSHSLSIIVVQAAGAEGLIGEDHHQAMNALSSIQEVGRQAQGEMVRMLGLLRGDHSDIGLAPQPRIDDVPALVDLARRGGLAVELEIEESLPALPASAELTVYRLIQEALTNVRRHAVGATTKIRVGVGNGVLQVEIRNTDGDASILTDQTSEQGLVGMRERVAMCGGTLSATAVPDGGFVVSARLPVSPP